MYPTPQTIAIDAKVLSLDSRVSLVTGLVFGLAPALRASKLVLQSERHPERRRPRCQRGARGQPASQLACHRRGRDLIRSPYWRGVVDQQLSYTCGISIPGFSADHLLTMNVDLSEIKYPDNPGTAGRIL